jgi:endonuclease/exonuclease/phosphatase family metal-dependent hydrolase
MVVEELRDLKLLVLNIFLVLYLIMLSFLTFNLALLQYTFFGHILYEGTNFVSERLQRIPSKIIQSDADVVALQEIYSLKHKKILVDKLKHHYPYHYYTAENFFLAMDNSMMFFSKFPIEKTLTYAFKNTNWEEYFFARMGVMKIELSIDNQKYSFFNVHLSAGGWSDPNSTKTRRLRSAQINELFGLVEKDKAKYKVILGDFNCGPITSPTNYKELVSHKSFFISENDHITWDPENTLNESSRYKKSKAQNIDHILLSNSFKNSYRILKYDTFFNKPDILIQGKRYAVSDHSGVRIALVTKE